jgi:hypothetical protein
MSNTHWTDQPAVIENAELVTSFVAGKAIYIYRNGDTYFLSHGNLFGSQTIETNSTEALLKAIGLVVNAKSGDQAKAPEGCTIIPNRESVEERAEKVSEVYDL